MHALLPLVLRRALPSAVSLIALLATTAAFAAQTQIAQVPLLNITGTGTVKPNVMLLMDDTLTMGYTYTPDYIKGEALCRSGATLASASLVTCDVGHAPFHSNDFNKQYYNPEVRYPAPVKADGTYFATQDSAATKGWTVVSQDGFGVDPRTMAGALTSGTISLLADFPDLKWCDSSNTVCKNNTSSYTYPDATYNRSAAIKGNPYYYRIQVSEYCTDDTLTVCKTTTVGASAPSGYPVPAKVRWCNSRVLTSCQGKRVGTFQYPRFSTATGAAASYGTISIGASATATSVAITSVTIPDPSTARTITNGTTTAATGTNTPLKQQTMATALAASINARTGLTNQYLACVRTPTGSSSVSPCSTFGITLSADSVVAVIAVTCSGTKNASNCVPVMDASRAGWGITVNATPATAVPSTALLNISGTSATSGSLKVTVSLAGTALVTNLALTNNRSASSIASAIVAGIPANGPVRAYIGGNAVTPTCAAKTSTSVCLVNTAATGNGDVPATTAVSGLGFTAVNGAGFSDSIPVQTAALAAGSAAPNTFARVDIVPGTTSYPRGVERADCAGTTCTYAEEMTNFANWYVYHKNRQQLLKTAVGLAFAPLTSNFRVGFATINQVGYNKPITYAPSDFAGNARSNWYTALYGVTPNSYTPMRTAVHNIGKMFANQGKYAQTPPVVQYACQQNFLLMPTDGYWNTAQGSEGTLYGLTATAADEVVSNDEVENPSRFCTDARGCTDKKNQQGKEPSLADVALYWYNGGSATTTVSLRPDLEPDTSKPGQVPAGPGENSHLHMNTFILGLGADGVMNFEPRYDTAPKVGGDFYNLITRAGVGCPWNGGGAFVWPDPVVTSDDVTVQARVDDMWHAAINGHGKYFSASQPKEVVDGLSEALSNIQIRTGAAAAAATSTPNISLQDNDIFSDTFTTVKWYGELSNKKIDPTTGIVSSTVAWISSDTVGRKVADSSDTRTIYMLDAAAGGLKNFSYGVMTATEKAWFDNKCNVLSQCTLLSAADRGKVNSGTNVVNWLRGQQQYADDNLFRAYSMTTNTPTGASGPLPIVLGDIASSKPAYLREPRKSYTTAGYSDFKEDNAKRAGTVFTAANDGMLHAFSAATGEELWAYVPRITMKKLYNLASTTYGTNHIFTTDGSPELADVQINGNWKTVLVAGLNGGGRGFYALDVTDPAAPRALWELCADSAICSRNDPDLGLSFGNPQFGLWRGKWVVMLTSGYNNVPGADGVDTGSGQGILYIVDVATGAVLKKVSTMAGSVTTPSGLAKITSISQDPNTDPQTTYVYGGDNQGQMWRFDLTDQDGGTVPVIKMGDAGASQPITTRPDVTLCAVTQNVDVAGLPTPVTSAQRVVLFGTGRLLDVPDTVSTDTQSLYLLKDSGTALGNIRGAGMIEQTLSQKGSGSSITYEITSNKVDLATKDGWFFDWKLQSGERMNLDPQIVSGVANVVTNRPSASSACTVGGSSTAYQVDVCTGNAVAGYPAGTILSANSAAVGFIIVRLPNGQLKMISTLATGETKTTALQEGKSADAHRVGWRRVKGE